MKQTDVIPHFSLPLWSIDLHWCRDYEPSPTAIGSWFRCRHLENVTAEYGETPTMIHENHHSSRIQPTSTEIAEQLAEWNKTSRNCTWLYKRVSLQTVRCKARIQRCDGWDSKISTSTNVQAVFTRPKYSTTIRNHNQSQPLRPGLVL